MPINIYYRCVGSVGMTQKCAPTSRFIDVISIAISSDKASTPKILLDAQLIVIELIRALFCLATTDGFHQCLHTNSLIL